VADQLKPFAIAQQQLDQAARIMELEPTTHELLRWPMRELQFTLPVRMDDGTIKIFHGLRVQYNSARGPTRGGLWFHPDETIAMARARAALMTWRTSVVNLPLGGATGGVACNPKELSMTELERLSRAYARKTIDIMGDDVDVPAPGIYTNPQVMAWILDEFEAIGRRHAPGMITGKPLALGGSEGRASATGSGVAVHIREAIRVLGLDPASCTASVQGFGNVGKYAAIDFVEKLGGKVACIACWDHTNRTAYTYAKDGGVDPRFLSSIADAQGTIDKERALASGYQVLDGDAWLEADVDVLVPAALEHTITAETVGKIRPTVKILAEAAGCPTTPAASDALNRMNVYVIPDFLCTAGGITVSYFEQIQNAYGFYWDEELVHQRLDQKLTSAFHDVHETSQQYKVTNRMGAYIVAVARVAEACHLRGWA